MASLQPPPPPRIRNRGVTPVQEKSAFAIMHPLLSRFPPISPTKIQCPLCPHNNNGKEKYVFPNFVYLLRHLRRTARHHDDQTLLESKMLGENQPCSKCPRLFPSQKLLAHHVRYMHEEKGGDGNKTKKPKPVISRRVTCGFCLAPFRSRKSLQQHISCLHEKSLEMSVEEEMDDTSRSKKRARIEVVSIGAQKEVVEVATKDGMVEPPPSAGKSRDNVCRDHQQMQETGSSEDTVSTDTGNGNGSNEFLAIPPVAVEIEVETDESSDADTTITILEDDEVSFVSEGPDIELIDLTLSDDNDSSSNSEPEKSHATSEEEKEKQAKDAKTRQDVDMVLRYLRLGDYAPVPNESEDESVLFPCTQCDLGFYTILEKKRHMKEHLFYNQQQNLPGGFPHPFSSCCRKRQAPLVQTNKKIRAKNAAVIAKCVKIKKPGPERPSQPERKPEVLLCVPPKGQQPQVPSLMKYIVHSSFDRSSTNQKEQIRIVHFVDNDNRAEFSKGPHHSTVRPPTPIPKSILKRTSPPNFN